VNTPNNTPPHVHSANEMLHRTASNSRCRGARTARTHADGKRSPERLYQNRETRSRCGRGPTGDPTCRPSKIQALPYQILHEMKPIIHESIRWPSPYIPVRAYQMECIRIGWRPAGHQATPHSANPYRDSANRPVTPGLHTAPIRRFPHHHVSVWSVIACFHTDRSRGNI